MITRRGFIGTGTALLAAAAAAQFSFGAGTATSPGTRPLPTSGADRLAGLRDRVDLPFRSAGGGRRYDWQQSPHAKRGDPNLYQPRKLDTDQWIEAAKACGARYAVFTATHFNGFMQWQSDLYPYGLKQTIWRGGKGDVVADFVASCRKAGIKPGIYFSVHRNVYQHVWGHYVDWGKGRGTPAQEKFNRIAEKQMEELCSRYGPLVELWFDAGTKTPAEGGPDMLPIFEKHQPDSVFYSSTERVRSPLDRQRSRSRRLSVLGHDAGRKRRRVDTTPPAGRSSLGSGDPERRRVVARHGGRAACAARIKSTTGSGRRTTTMPRIRPTSWCKCISTPSAATATSSSAK